MTNNRHKILYCKKCGFVDLASNTSKCKFCNNELSSTEEFFDEICSSQEFSSKEEIEEYVRQTYVYFDENYDEDLMNQRENENNIQNQIDYFEDKFLNENSNVAKCPTCGSDDIEHISTSDKIAGGLMFGLFSSNVRKTMRCNNCGYKW